MLSQRWFAPALVCAALLMSFNSASAAEVDYLSFFPANSDVVGSVNLQALRGTDTWRTMRPLLEKVPGVQQTSSSLAGVDIDDLLTQVDQVHFASVPSAGKQEIVIVARGTVNQGAMRAALEASESTQRADLGSHASFTDSGQRIAFVDDSTIIAGADAIVSAYLGSMSASQATSFPEGLRAQISSVDRSQMVWIAGVITNDMRAAAPMLDASVRGVSFSLSLASGLQGKISIQAGEEALAAMEREFEQSRGQVAQTPELAALGLAPLLEGLSFATNNGRGELTLAVAAADWNRMLVMVAALLESEL